MKKIGTSLRVKYRLEEVPTETQAVEWARLVESLVKDGLDLDTAGREAANRLFIINDRLILKAEADTIEALLERAKAK